MQIYKVWKCFFAEHSRVQFNIYIFLIHLHIFTYMLDYMAEKHISILDQ